MPVVVVAVVKVLLYKVCSMLFEAALSGAAFLLVSGQALTGYNAS
jgi:hypothetical protein